MMSTSAGRGALIVLEGCDRVGKSTQCKKLVQALQGAGHPIKHMHFPDRSTLIGQQINEYLTLKKEMDDRSIHLLFSANRWELESQMRRALMAGTSLVVDRYAYSGVAFTSAKQVASLDWCKGPDRGLPEPDVVLYLHLSPQEARKRDQYGVERYEKMAFQEAVSKRFNELFDPSNWHRIDASSTIDDIHQEILKHTTEVMDEVSKRPIKTLWTNDSHEI